MNAIFRHRGITIDYTPTADVTAGDIVSEGGINGVANNDIPANTLGALAVVGVFDVEKKTGDAFAFGDTVNWDKVNKQALKTTGSNIVKLGVAVEAAIGTDPVVRVRLQ
ncbi:MAG: DUF2190 family protein [Thermoguttaceae bacterium]